MWSAGLNQSLNPNPTLLYFFLSDGIKEDYGEEREKRGTVDE